MRLFDRWLHPAPHPIPASKPCQMCADLRRLIEWAVEANNAPRVEYLQRELQLHKQAHAHVNPYRDEA